ncbi:hypothetical protein MN116_006292 [Schistosoma mekongi]|uniref:Uncharacterized protein n=1 Tax=Schistosoma mekongi TaxID=38744 RepID=A0AAE2D5D8_SCHME|nr:hypothetical protein MN116_006292 [Schistosoma mekongi]
MQTSSLLNKTISSTNHDLFQYREEDKSDVKKQCTAGLLGLCCIIINKKLENARRFVTLGGVEKCQELLKFCINNGHLIRFDCNTEQLLNEDKTTQIVIKLLRQLLFMLWQFTELRPIYKLTSYNAEHCCFIIQSLIA